MRTFKLNRLKDPSGVSGVGIVAEGVEFHDGEVALSWFGERHCVSIWNNVKDLLAVHGHDGKTQIEFDRE